jgi:SAM-dependent methyltransferase
MTNRLLNRLTVSPREKTPTPCGNEEILSGRKPAQMGWYEFAASVVDGQSVLDVGCGSGEGLKLLSARASDALGIDLDDRLRRQDVNVRIQSVSDIPDKSFDIVVSMDVIEHVPDDRAFVADLFRVARKAVFLTTPNYAVSRNRHPYHVREYTPGEFERLFRGYGNLELYAGSAHGFERVRVTRRRAYFLVNALYCWKPTVLAAKIVKRLLGVKVWKHNAALVRLRGSAATAGAPAAAA